MDKEIILHKGFYWPIKDGSQPITSEYAHTDSTCYNLMNIFQHIPENISKYVDNKNVIIQAGGNAGFYVKKYSELFKKVYTFEPDPISFYCLNLNVTSPNVYKFQACLGSQNQCVNLYNTHATLGHGGSHVIGQGDIPTFKIDNLNLSECNLIHLDIEGYEKFAILGGIETIKRCKPVIVVEDFPSWKARYNSSLQEIEVILFDLGYKLIGQVENDTDKIYKYINC